MRVVVQRVTEASVSINSSLFSKIQRGLLVFAGIELTDNEDDIDWLCGKIARLRLFDDENGVMNLSVQEIQGEILVVSQFTLHAKTKKGNRPSYIQAAPPDIAIPLYEKFIQKMECVLQKKISVGKFGAMMQVALVNDGPVTIIIDSKHRE
jgi:D-tyrosyl-tRNA(Tyr) deacylase